MPENKLKHLEFIQDAIARMANHSFYLKGWTVTLVVAILALTKNSIHCSPIFLVILIPIIAFWILDGYFLYQEKLFRELYKDVAKKDPKDIDFLMSTKQYKDTCEHNKISTILSETLCWFYPVVVLLVIAAYLYF